MSQSLTEYPSFSPYIIPSSLLCRVCPNQHLADGCPYSSISMDSDILPNENVHLQLKRDSETNSDNQEKGQSSVTSVTNSEQGTSSKIHILYFPISPHDTCSTKTYTTIPTIHPTIYPTKSLLASGMPLAAFGVPSGVSEEYKDTELDAIFIDHYKRWDEAQKSLDLYYSYIHANFLVTTQVKKERLIHLPRQGIPQDEFDLEIGDYYPVCYEWWVDICDVHNDLE